MLVQDIINSVNARLRQRGESKSFSNSAIIDYANEISLEISDALEFTRTVRTFTPNSDNRVYLPADAGRIEYVGRNGVEIYPMTPKEAALLSADLSTSLGGWYGYLFTNGYLQLGSQEPITIHNIVYSPKFESANQDINIREEYRMPFINGIAYLCFLELGQNDKAAAYKAEYKNELNDRRETIRGNAFKGRKYPSIPAVEL